MLEVKTPKIYASTISPMRTPSPVRNLKGLQTWRKKENTPMQTAGIKPLYDIYTRKCRPETLSR